jgi:hypothetical protein
LSTFWIGDELLVDIDELEPELELELVDVEPE